MPVKVKICGLSRTEEVEYVNELMPEYIGLVFYKKSKRYVDDLQAATLSKMLNEKITPVGVFVDEPVEHVAKLLREGTIRVAQLHGHEDEAYIARLRELVENTGDSRWQIIKAFMIKSNEDIDRASDSSADFILLDNGYGTGECFDWNCIKPIDRPFFLAGGLDITNVSRAIEQFQPYAVDVSSSVERDGYKDYDKIKEFIQEVRGQVKKTWYI